ncbi:MAG: SMC-Scp complex subunit ScpB [Oscillospiraceae bacterium]|nr:SMC-Scp complex subunit ScpB [Oscillospiraceae bacterium]
MAANNMSSAIESILFAAGDPVSAERIALTLDITVEEVFSLATELSAEYERGERGLRLVRLEDRLQLCSAPEYSEYIMKTLEQRRQPRLSKPALEVLATVAYFQPVTRAYIERVRGVDSSYTVGILAERGLIEPCGRSDAPGRPVLYGTGDVFLRTMGIASLEELPALPDVGNDEGLAKLKDAVESLTVDGQIMINEKENPPGKK